VDRLQEMRREGLLDTTSFFFCKRVATCGTPIPSVNFTDVVPIVWAIVAGAVVVLLLATELYAMEIFSKKNTFKYQAIFRLCYSIWAVAELHYISPKARNC
jgi:hypothetical protein